MWDLAISALLLSAAPSTVKPFGPIRVVVTGPSWLCSSAFALRLNPREKAIAFDGRLDFVTYQVSGPEGRFVIYEGNAPQRADYVRKTGLGWPNFVALHDNRAPAAKRISKLPARMLFPPRIPPPCRNKPTLREP